jgi:hypothetical protein
MDLILYKRASSVLIYWEIFKVKWHLSPAEGNVIIVRLFSIGCMFDEVSLNDKIWHLGDQAIFIWVLGHHLQPYHLHFSLEKKVKSICIQVCGYSNQNQICFRCKETVHAYMPSWWCPCWPRSRPTQGCMSSESSGVDACFPAKRSLAGHNCGLKPLLISGKTPVAANR